MSTRTAKQLQTANRQVLLLLSGLAVAVAGAVGTAAYLMERASHPQTGGEIAAAEQFVRDQFPRGLELYFSSPAETSAAQLPGGRYRVTGWVEAVAKPGGSVRETYTCSMHLGANGGWESDEVILLQK